MQSIPAFVYPTTAITGYSSLCRLWRSSVLWARTLSNMHFSFISRLFKILLRISIWVSPAPPMDAAAPSWWSTAPSTRPFILILQKVPSSCQCRTIPARHATLKTHVLTYKEGAKRMYTHFKRCYLHSMHIHFFGTLCISQVLCFNINPVP